MSENMNKDWVCSKCGTLNDSGNFCAECGEPKPAAPVVPTPTPAPAPAPAPEAKPKESPADEKQANILCTISVVCMYAAPTLAGIILKVIEAALYDTDMYSILSGAVGIIVCLAWIAAIVIMILVRVKYPRNVFGKVLMWIYIAQTVLAVIAIIIAVIACAALVQQCQGF